MILYLFALTLIYISLLGSLRLNDITAATPGLIPYRHYPAHRAHPNRRTVPADYTPLPHWVRVQLAPTVHGGRLADEAGAR